MAEDYFLALPFALWKHFPIFLRPMVGIHHKPVATQTGCEVAKRPTQNRFVGNSNQRLGQAVGQGTQPRAETGSENKGSGHGLKNRGIQPQYTARFPIMDQDDPIFLRKRLESAEGYLMLEMDDEAWAELEDLSVDDLPTRDDKAAYLALVLELALRSKDWDLGARIAEALVVVKPSHIPAYVHGAYCLHELGQTDKARALLIAGPADLRDEPLYFYNLGCYHAVLGDRLQALACLHEAFQRDPKLKKTARKDPDLQGLGQF